MNNKFTLSQRGREVQEILDRDIFLSQEEYDNLVANNNLDETKVYFVYEEELE